MFSPRLTPSVSAEGDTTAAIEALAPEPSYCGGLLIETDSSPMRALPGEASDDEDEDDEGDAEDADGTLPLLIWW